MPKLILSDLTQLSANEIAALEAINNNNKAIEDAIENSVSRDGSVPNFMTAQLDMNSNRIINLGEPTGELDAVRYKDIADLVATTTGLQQSMLGVQEATALKAQEAATSAANAAADAITVANAVTSPEFIAISTDLAKGEESEIVKANANKANIDTVAANIDNVNAVGNISEAVTTVAGITADVTTVATDSMDIIVVAEAIEAVKTDAENIEAIKATANNETNINTVVTNLTDIQAAPAAAVNAAASASAALMSEQAAELAADHAESYATTAEGWAVGDISTVPDGSAKYWASQAQASAQISNASENVAGIVRLATASEALAGTDNTTAMTPSKVSAVVNNSVYDAIGQGIVLGFDGTLSGNVLTFEPSEGAAYALKNNYDYEVDLHFPAVGTLDDDVVVRIVNGTDEIAIRNVLSGSENATYGNLRQVCNYVTYIGWRWIFTARYKSVNTDRAFIMQATTVALAPTLDNPSENTAPSTQAVANALEGLETVTITYWE